MSSSIDSVNINITPIADYVEELMKLMFSLPKATLKETFDRFSSKAPETLTAQFPNRASRAEAVKSYKERQKISTKLFPADKMSPLVQCISPDTKYKIKEKKKLNWFYFIFVS